MWHQQKSTYTIGHLSIYSARGTSTRSLLELGDKRSRVNCQRIFAPVNSTEHKLNEQCIITGDLVKWPHRGLKEHRGEASLKHQTAGLWMKHLKHWWLEASDLTFRVVCFFALLGQFSPYSDAGSSTVPSSPWAQLCLEAYSEPFQLSSQTHHIAWNSRKTNSTNSIYYLMFHCMIMIHLCDI